MSRPAVAPGPNGFVTKRGFRSNATRWSEVQAIRGVMIEKITYDESFLIVMTPTKSVYLGELDSGFQAFERALLERFPDFPADWKKHVEAAGHESYVTLWQSQSW